MNRPVSDHFGTRVGCAATLAAILAAVLSAQPLSAETTAVGAWPVDYASFLSKHDVVYRGPAWAGWQGLPLGNGKLGAQVWQPGPLALQLNTALSAVYGGGICQLYLTSQPGMTEGLQSYLQRLSLYDATLNTQFDYANGRLKGRMFIPATQDAVIYQLVELPKDRAFRLLLKTWRDSASIAVEDDIVLMTDKLSERHEPDYRFAVAVALDGGSTTIAKPVDGAVTLEINAAPATIVVSFAESRDPEADVSAEAMAQLARLRSAGPESLHHQHRGWWARFWRKSLLDVSSTDEKLNSVVDYLANCWYMHIYAMGAGHRGQVPAKFNGGLWTYEQDKREWGKSYWHWNQQEAAWPIFASNHTELFQPYENLYLGMLPVVEQWTKEMYGLDGVQIQETIPFHGHMPHWKTVEGVHPRVPVPAEFRHTNAIFSTTPEICMIFWWYWEHTRDEKFLREKCYPLMKKAAQFYIGYLERDDSGRYIMWPSNAQESFWRVLNPTPDLASVRYLFPRVIATAERLGIDEQLQAQCRERLQHLAEYPIDPQTGSIMPYELRPGEEIKWRNAENPRIFPFAVMPLMTLGTADYRLALTTFAHRRKVCGYGWNVDAIGAARLGLADEEASRQLYPGVEKLTPQHRGVAYLLPEHVQRYQNYPCGLQDYYSRKPAMHYYLEGSGTMTTALSETLLQDFHGVIRLAPALPADWDARFTLAARGGVLVSAECRGGQVAWASLDVPSAQALTMANPFDQPMLIRCDGKEILRSSEATVTWQAEAGRRYLVLPVDMTAEAVEPAVVTGQTNDQPKTFGRRMIGIARPEDFEPPPEPEEPKK